ncbi:MAG: mechanosensitive ion channel [Candidatus Caldarchaeum sp.]
MIQLQLTSILETVLWIASAVGLFLLLRMFFAPLVDLVSQRIGGALRVGALVSAYLIAVAKVVQQADTWVAAAAGAGLVLFTALCFRPLKLMALGDIMKAVGVLREGDYVSIGGRVARVTEVKATHTILTTSDLRKLYIPNDRLLSEKIVNFTKSGAGVLFVRIKIDGRRISIPDAKLILLKTGTDIAKAEAAPNRAPEVRVEKIEDPYVTLRLTLYVINPAKAEPLASHIMERVYTKLSEAAAAAAI